jgi:hypothetical protein
VHSLLNKIFSLSISVAIVLATFLAYHFINDFQAVSATNVSANEQLMPFDAKEMFETGQSQNKTVENSSDIIIKDSPDKIEECEMPPCPPDHACIQSCP